MGTPVSDSSEKGRTMKVGHFGSCLSALPIAALVTDYGWKEAFRIHHNRSDVFVNYFVDKSHEQFDYAWLNDFLKAKPETAADAMSFVENQFVPWIGYENTLRHLVTPESNFPEDIKTMDVDVIVLDNFIDIAGCVWYPKDNPDKKVFFAAHLYENLDEINEKWTMSSYLTPQESAENWLKIYRWFRAVKPKAKIFFTCWSPATSRGNEPRTRRILDFYDVFYDMVKDEDLYLLPPVNVPDELTNGPDDWYHVHKDVYKAIAGYIFLHTAGELPPHGKMTHWS